MSVLGLLTDNSLKDNTGDDIGGAEVDVNPQVIANVLDGTTIEALGTTAAVQFTAIDINGGTIDGATIGANSASTGAFTTLSATGGGSLTGTWTDLGTVTTVDINGGTIDGVTIGGASAGAGTFTTLTATSTTDLGATTVDSLNVSDGNITNVGDISLDSISPDSGSSITVNAVPTFTSAGFPNFYVHRDTNSGTSGLEIVMQFDNSSNAVADYASIRTELVGNTASSENGFLALKTARSGTLTESMRADHLGNVIINTAAIATNATDGFLYIPTCAGSPSGTPTSYSGRAPIVLDTSNNRLYLYDGGWIYASLT